MNGIFGQLDQSYKSVWVTNSGAVGRGTKLENLAPEQIAVFPADEYCAVEDVISLSAPNFKTNKRLVLKQGIAPFAGQTNVFLSRQDKRARSSFEFEAKDIVSWSGLKGSLGAKPEVVAIGYDGIDASKSLSAILDAKPLYINLRLSGEPIKRFFHRNFIDHRFVVDKGLCLGDCDIYDACGKVPCDLIADAIIKQVSTQDLFVPGKNGTMYRAPIRQFVKASKLKKCTTAKTPLVLTEKRKYTISICDDGQSTLGKIAAKYPDLKIVKESRVDSVTTYATWLDYTPTVNEVSSITVTNGVTTTEGVITVTVNGVAYTTGTIAVGATQDVVALAIKNAIGSTATVLGAVVTVTGIGAVVNASTTSNPTGLAVTSATVINGVTGTTAPEDFVLSTHVQPICDSCPTCTGDYTEVSGLKIVQVRVSRGASAPVIPGAITTTLISSTLSGGDVYLVKVALATADEVITASFTEAMDAHIIGTESKQCVGEDVSFSWTSCENCFATTAKYMITLPDADCKTGQSRLAELQEAYPNLVIADRSEGSCMHSYETTVTSNCLPQEVCDREMAEFKFKAPAGYEGYLWSEYKAPVTSPDCTVPEAPVEPCCSCGVAFETAFWDQKTDECTFGWTHWHPTNKKPVRMQVNIHSSDYSGNPCDEHPEYSTILQKLSMDLGTYGELVQEYERSNTQAYEGKFWVSNPYANGVSGFKVTAKAETLYDQYTLRLKTRQYGDSNHLQYQGVMDYIIYVPTGEGKEIEDFFNELVLSTGNPDLKAVKL